MHQTEFSIRPKAPTGVDSKTPPRHETTKSTDFNRLPDEANVSVKDASFLTGLGVSTIWSKAKSGHFPQPKRFGSRTFWKMGDIRHWLNTAGC
jgi:Prophage CP4-57 regulatory protein (AlpA).